MATETLIESLVADLRPVKPRNRSTETLILAGLGALQLLLFVVIYGVRADFMPAMHSSALWWKVISMGVIALLGVAAVLRSLDPANAIRTNLGRIAAVAAIALAAGWLIDAGAGGREALLARLNWHHGLQCVWMVFILSQPAVIGLTLLARHGAPTDLPRTALAAGLAAAGWGGFVFAFACPFDDPLYVAVWYTVAVIAVAAPMRWLLPKLTRW